MESKLKVRSEKELSTGSTVAYAREGSPLTLEAQLTAAVKRRELHVHFQPQYDVDCGQGLGVEALARWTLPDGEDISPTVFIPMAERIAIIGPLGAWVLAQACEIVAGWGTIPFTANGPGWFTVYILAPLTVGLLGGALYRLLLRPHYSATTPAA